MSSVHEYVLHFWENFSKAANQPFDNLHASLLGKSILHEAEVAKTQFS